MKTLAPEGRELVLEQIERLAQNWGPLVGMRDHLAGAETFAVSLLIDSDHTMTEAERLVAEAIERGVAKAAKATT